MKTPFKSIFNYLNASIFPICCLMLAFSQFSFAREMRNEEMQSMLDRRGIIREEHMNPKKVVDVKIVKVVQVLRARFCVQLLGYDSKNHVRLEIQKCPRNNGFSVSLFSKTGQEFPQTRAFTKNERSELLENLAKANRTCPVNLRVTSSGGLAKSEIACGSFSENQDLSPVQVSNVESASSAL